MNIYQAIILTFVGSTFGGLGCLVSGQWKLAGCLLTLATTIYLLFT